MPQVEVMAIPAALSLASSVAGGYFADKRADEAEDKWRDTAYPNKAAVNAQATQNRGQLGQARLGATQNLFSNLASRGFASGSGLGAAGMSGINRGYLQGLGNMMTELTKFKNTPMWGPPSAMYPQTGPWESGFNTLSSMMNQGMGFMMMKNMMGGTGGVNMYDPYPGTSDK